MESIIILLAITIINPTANAHENHNHQIYNWSNSKNKIIKSESTFNIEKLEDKKNNTKNNTISSWIKIFRRKINF
tara:strand:+ start:121 stop:345 length:225 start_codon:yes stop_codon:yes gene_type:complete